MIDPHSETWADVAAFVAQGADKSRRVIEAPGVDHAETQFQRGRLAAFNELASLPDRQRAVPPVIDTGVTY